MSYSVAVFSYNKHQNLLPYCLHSIKKNLSNYQEIVVVWDDYVRERPVDFNWIKQKSGVDFRVIKHTEIYNWPQKIGEWGWIKQQLVKMYCHSYINSEQTYIVDGDVVFLKDPALYENNKTVIRYDSDYCPPKGYKDFIQNYLNLSQFYDSTWVGSSALFDHDVLHEIDQQCIENYNMNLIDCVNHMISSGNHSDLPFSEFETYGTYCWNNYRDRFVFKEKNWNYPTESAKDISIMWAEEDDCDLDEKYCRLTGYSI